MTDSFRLNESTASAVSASAIPVGASATSAAAPCRSLPSPRHGAQAYFWTTDWQQRERLADWDFLSGNTFRPAGAEDLIRHLQEEAASSAETD